MQEIADLVVSDVMYNDSSLVKLTGKGNKSRFVPLEGTVVKLLCQYLEDFSLTSPSKRTELSIATHIEPPSPLTMNHPSSATLNH